MEYLPPVVARLVGDVSDYVRKMRQAEANTAQFADAAVKATRNTATEFEAAGERIAEDIAAGIEEGVDASEMSLGEAWKKLGSLVGERLGDFFKAAGERAATNLVVGLKLAAEPVVNALKPVWEAVAAKAEAELIIPLRALGQKVGGAIADGVKRSVWTVTSAAQSAAAAVASAARQWGSTIATGIGMWVAPIGAAISRVGASIASRFEGEIGTLLKFIGKKSAERLWEGIKGGLSTVGTFLKDALASMASKTWSAVSGFFSDLGKKAVASIGEGIKSNVAGALGAAKKFAGFFGDSLQDALGTLFEKIPIFGTNIASAITSNPYVALGAAGVAAVLAPVLAGALSSALTSALALGVGAGLLGLGAMVLADNERLVEQAQDSFAAIKKTMADAAQPLVGPFIRGLKDVQRIVKDLGPTFKALFAGVAPIVKRLTDALGPMLKGVLGGLQQALPGINAAFNGLARAMPGLGAAIGRFFAVVFSNAPMIERLTKGLIDFVSWIIGVAGPAVHGLTVIWGAFTNLMHLASINMGAIWERIKKAFDGGTGALARISAAWKPLKDAITETWKALEAFAGASEDKDMQKKLDELVAKIKAIWAPLKTFLGVVWAEAWEFVKRKWNEVVVPWWEGTAKPWLEHEVKDFVKDLFKGMVRDALDALTPWSTEAAAKTAPVGPAIKNSLKAGTADSGNWLHLP